MIYPRLNQSLKWKNDYIFFEKEKNNDRNKDRKRSRRYVSRFAK